MSSAFLIAGLIIVCVSGLAQSVPWVKMMTSSNDVERHVLKFESSVTIDKAWNLFKEQHGKIYASGDEEMARKMIFTENLNAIELHNYLYGKGLKSFTMGVNKYTDMTHKEFVTSMNGWRKPKNSTRSGSSYLSPNIPSTLPDTVDWRYKGYVTRIKDQGNCKSSWAFSATGSLEGQNFRKTGTLTSLSEQNLIDCSTENFGCKGGDQDSAFDYIKENKGIDTEDSYPYEAKKDTCRYKAADKGATDTGCVDIKEFDEDELKEAVANIGPISVTIDARNPSFQSYRSGIYDEPLCDPDLVEQGLLVVGYGTINGQDYWLAKNSWGIGWGDKGYIYMSRNKNNQCGIASWASYPLV